MTTEQKNAETVVAMAEEINQLQADKEQLSEEIGRLKEALEEISPKSFKKPEERICPYCKIKGFSDIAHACPATKKGNYGLNFESEVKDE